MSIIESRRKPLKTRGNLRKPFSSDVLGEAKQLAYAYQILIWFEDGEYYGRGLELPFTAADGKTPQACFEKVREAMVGTVAHMLERGETPPLPAADAGRTEQVNIRLSALEKLRMEESARAQGFRGIADFLRARAL